MQRPYDGEIDWHSLYQETLAQCELADAGWLLDNLCSFRGSTHFLYQDPASLALPAPR